MGLLFSSIGKHCKNFIDEFNNGLEGHKHNQEAAISWTTETLQEKAKLYYDMIVQQINRAYESIITRASNKKN
jgi:hypothetical protein